MTTPTMMTVAMSPTPSMMTLAMPMHGWLFSFFFFFLDTNYLYRLPPAATPTLSATAAIKSPSEQQSLGFGIFFNLIYFGWRFFCFFFKKIFFFKGNYFFSMFFISFLDSNIVMYFYSCKVSGIYFKNVLSIVVNV